MENENLVIDMLETMASIMPGGERVTTAGAKLMMFDLNEYPTTSILEALQRCRKELTRFPTIAEIITRVQMLDGRPGAEEAWAMCPKDEYASVFLNAEIMAGFEAANSILINTGDFIAARMAFKEVYERTVKENRSRAHQPKWWLSQGRDILGRSAALHDAIEKKRISLAEASKKYPGLMEPQGDRLTIAGMEGMASLSDVTKKLVAQEILRDKE